MANMTSCVRNKTGVVELSDKSRRKYWLSAPFLGLLLISCQTNPMKEDSAGMPTGDLLAEANDATLIVDCLLPGKIKKLGSSFTYLTPRRPIKASAMQCEIRGGEYVAYDRANYKTALKIWRPLAEGGDMVAQTYVGAIYEKGLGIEPDYQQAASWYQKAANQEYSRAQHALGYLYEKGLGVNKDPQQAFRWYRKAAGLDEEDLKTAYIELGEKETAKLTQAREAEQRLLKKIKGELVSSQDELGRYQVKLTDAKQTLVVMEQEAKKQETKAQQAKQTQQQSLASLQDHEQKTKALEAQFEDKKRQLATLDETLGAQKERALLKGAELSVLVDKITARKTVLHAELSRLAEASKTVAQSGDTANLTSRQAEIDKEKAVVQTELAEKETRLAEAKIAVKNQQAVAEQKGKELLALLKDVESRKAALQTELASLENEKNKAEQHRLTLVTERQQSSKSWQEKQNARTAVLAQQRDVIVKLETQAQNNKEKLAYLQRVEKKQKLAILAPTIEIIDPQVPLSRSMTQKAPILKVRSGVQERTIVGRVLSQEALLLVSVNDIQQPISAAGVFNTKIKVQSAGTLVDVVAVNASGDRSELKFVLAPEQASRQVNGGESDDVVVIPSRAEAIPDIDFGDYYALLIGNDDYKYLPELITPIKDVEHVAKLLGEKYGFKEVQLLENATRYDIISSINKLRQKLTDKDNLLVYYAGHGELDRINMTGQWLPVDAETENTANWISNSSLTELINTISARHILVVADSCYSGIMTRSALTNIESGKSEAVRKTWIEKMVKKRSRTVLTSGGVAPVLDEGGGDHSIFARAFINALKANNGVLEGQRLYRQVSAAVAVAADRYKVDQVPEYAPIRHAGHESGDFFLVPNFEGVLAGDVKG